MKSPHRHADDESFVEEYFDTRAENQRKDETNHAVKPRYLLSTRFKGRTAGSHLLDSIFVTTFPCLTVVDPR